MKLLGTLLDPAADRRLTAWLFLKGLAAVYAVAFASLAVQIDGLAGPDGILPLRHLLNGAYAEFGWRAWWRIPTLFWLASGDAWLRGAAYAGVTLAVLLFAGWGRPRPLLIALYVLYLSLYHAGQIFTTFQWDYLLLETGFLAIFLADAPTRLVVLLFEWLLFRLRFLSGFFKLQSGDPSWRHLTALDYYFETQPLPHVGSWYAHQLPHIVLRAGAAFTLVAELIVPFFIFLPRPFRLLAAAVTVLAQLLIIATSNHNFINLLTILLCLFLLDDRVVGRIVPLRLAAAPLKLQGPGPMARTCAFAAALLMTALSVSVFEASLHRSPLPGVQVALPRMQSAFNEIAPSFGLGNLFHLFPTMQTERQELRISGSNDGKTWQSYEFRYKPDAPDRAPPFVVPHQPRLDWMMWFLPAQWPDTNYWFEPFLEALRHNQATVTRLLARNPFERGAPPSELRVQVYRYRFTTAQERSVNGDWWKADYLGEYPNVSPRRP